MRQSPRLSAFRSYSSVASAVAMAIGGGVLISYWLGLPPLSRLFVGQPQVAPTTALALLLAGKALALSVERPVDRRRAPWRYAGQRACAVTVMLIGLLALSGYLFGWDLFMDRRMAPATALGVFLVGGALLLLEMETRRGRYPTQFLALVVATLAFVAIVRYVLGVEPSEVVAPFVLVALPTAVGLGAVAVGLLCADPDRGVMAVITSDGLGGTIARALILAAMGGSLVAMWLVAVGELTGLYTRAFATVITVVSIVSVWHIAIWWYAAALTRLETERQQAQESLLVQAAALQAAANGIIITDREGRIIWVNPACTRLTGYTAEEAIGKNPRVLKSGQHDQAFYRDLWETILSGQVWRGETINRRKDGSLYVENQTITPVRDERGEISHFIAIKEDISARKRIETEIRELNLQLEQRVEARTWELQAANRSLEEASRHKSAFLANMSHELRTPLNAILGFSELLQDQTYGELSAKQARYLGHIHQSGQHLLSLINDLLDLSKVEAGRLELRWELVALPEALAAALDEIRPLADQKCLTLTLRAEQAPVTLHADPVRFKQILYNLLSNAVKFTPDGGQITVTAHAVRGPGCGVRGAEYVEIAVQDTGIGIQAEDLPRLFQPFTQIEFIRAKQHQGTGLGLVLTKHLVELHEGSITAASAGSGRGSIFTVRLPLTHPPSFAGDEGHERTPLSLEGAGGGEGVT